MESEFSNVKMEIAELRKQIEELKKSKDCKEKEINEFDNDLFNVQNELLHSQYKHNKATKFINSQVKKIEDIKIDIMFLSAYVFRLFRQYKDSDNYCLKATNYKRTEEYRKLDEEYNRLHDIIIKCMKDIDL